MLNCMVTCRGADKKPNDNIMKIPAITQLVKNDLKAISGGDTISSILSEKEETFSAFSSSIAKSIGTSAISTFLVEPSSKGNILPLCQVTGTE